MECTQWNGIFINGTNFGGIVRTSDAGMGGYYYCHPRCRQFIVKNRLKRLGMGKKQEKCKNIAVTIRRPLQWILCAVNYMLTKMCKQSMPYRRDTTCNDCQLIAINYGPNFAFIYIFKSSH